MPQLNITAKRPAFAFPQIIRAFADSAFQRHADSLSYQGHPSGHPRACDDLTSRDRLWQVPEPLTYIMLPNSNAHTPLANLPRTLYNSRIIHSSYDCINGFAARGTTQKWQCCNTSSQHSACHNKALFAKARWHYSNNHGSGISSPSVFARRDHPICLPVQLAAPCLWAAFFLSPDYQTTVSSVSSRLTVQMRFAYARHRLVRVEQGW